MRTSNKILLATFIAIVLIITGIQAVLFAKIKSNDLVVFRSSMRPPSLEKHETPNIKHVLVIGLEECRVIYSDTASIGLTKNWNEHLKWKVNGDSLIVQGSGNRDYVMGERIYVPVELNLPADVTVHARYSNLYVRGAGDSAKAFSRVLSTENSFVSITSNSRVGWPAYWKKLQVTSQHGEINISPDAEIAEMNATLINCAFTDGGANFGSLSVSVDSTSTISLRQGSLEKLKLIKR